MGDRNWKLWHHVSQYGCVTANHHDTPLQERIRRCPYRPESSIWSDFPFYLEIFLELSFFHDSFPLPSLEWWGTMQLLQVIMLWWSGYIHTLTIWCCPFSVVQHSDGLELPWRDLDDLNFGQPAEFLELSIYIRRKHLGWAYSVGLAPYQCILGGSDFVFPQSEIMVWPKSVYRWTLIDIDIRHDEIVSIFMLANLSIFFLCSIYRVGIAE